MKYFNSSSSCLVDKKRKLITSFNSFIIQLKEILDFQHQFISSHSSSSNPPKVAGIVIVFDDISYTEKIENGLQDKLLDLGQVKYLLLIFILHF